MHMWGMMHWKGVLASPCSGYITHWFVRTDEATLELNQLPLMHVGHAPIIVGFSADANQRVRGILACVRLSTGVDELVVFNLQEDDHANEEANQKNPDGCGH